MVIKQHREFMVRWWLIKEAIRVWNMPGDQRAESSVDQVVEVVLQEEDDSCGGLTELVKVGEGDEQIMYVALEQLDETTSY